MNISAEEVLRGYAVGVLKQIARQAGLNVQDTRKEAHVQALKPVLFDPQRIQRELAGLDARERVVLDRLIERGGEASTEGLELQIVDEGLVKPRPPRSSSGYRTREYVGSNRPGSDVFVDVVAWLTVKGLVFSRGSSGYGTVLTSLDPGLTLFIPDAILAQLPKPAPRRTELPVVEVGHQQPASAAVFQRDLFLYWSYLRWNPVSLTQRDLVPKRDLAKINATLLVQEDLADARNEDETGRLYFLRLMLQETGLVKWDGQRLVIAEQSQEFFKDSLPVRSVRCLDGWLNSLHWNELLRIPGLNIDFSRNRDRRAGETVLKARRFVAEQLARTTPGRWFALDGFIHRCRITNYEFLFPRQKHRWYGSISPYSSYNNPLGWDFGMLDEAKGWDRVEAGFIRAVLTEPVHWLGLVDLGQESDRLVAARLTPLGAQVLGLPVEAEPEPPPGRLILQPNFHLLAIDPVSDYTLAVLDTFADRTRVDRAIEYVISRDSVYRARQEGMEVEAILRFLEDACQTEVPQNVHRTLEEWSAEQERIVIRRGVTLLQVADAALLDELLADPVVAQRLARRASPTVAVVSPAKGAPAAVRKALEQRDLLPAVSRLTDTPTGAVAAELDGRLVFQHPAPSFFVQQRLAPFTEPVAPHSPSPNVGRGEAGDEGNDLRLTPDSVRRAVAAGLAVDSILETLQSVNRGPLPGGLAESIKAWGRYYGQVKIEETTLLRVQDQAVLDELRNDTEVGPLLRSFARRGAVAVVKKGQLEKLRRALADKGIEVTGDDSG
jgi:hypothetical protein